MRAGDLATPFPTAGAGTMAVEAARLLAEHNLPGLIAVDEAAADVFLQELAARTVAEVRPEQPRELAVVDPDATVLEIARTPLVAVVSDGGSLAGAVTLDVLPEGLVGS